MYIYICTYIVHMYMYIYIYVYSPINKTFGIHGGPNLWTHCMRFHQDYHANSHQPYIRDMSVLCWVIKPPIFPRKSLLCLTFTAWLCLMRKLSVNHSHNHTSVCFNFLHRFSNQQHFVVLTPLGFLHFILSLFVKKHSIPMIHPNSYEAPQRLRQYETCKGWTLVSKNGRKTKSAMGPFQIAIPSWLWKKPVHVIFPWCDVPQVRQISLFSRSLESWSGESSPGPTWPNKFGEIWWSTMSSHFTKALN